MKYDRGFLRYIKCGDVEVLRMIYFALRDHNWDTMEGKITNEVMESGAESFSLSYQWISTDPAFPFQWVVRILGSDNLIEYSIDGEALADVRKNRTGFCILHPIKECAGKPCEISTPSGDVVKGQFPRLISPHQPFKNMQSMKWEIPGKGRATLVFEGDVFEMEDQRNWTDDSYKTYCTPLDIPFPVQLKKGDRVSQKVTLTFDPFEGASAVKESGIVLSPGKKVSRVPDIGFESKGGLEANELQALQSIGGDHIRGEVRFSQDSWRQTLAVFVEQSKQFQCSLELVLFFTESFQKEIQGLIEVLGSIDVSSGRLLLLQESNKSTPDHLLDLVLPLLREHAGSWQIGAGTNAYFTELNRERPKINNLDFIFYSVNPQVHAFDDASLTETLEAQAYTVESARVLAGGLPVYITPITLKPRFNPNATGPEPDPKPGELPSQVDVRQMELYGALWTLGSILHLADSGVHGMTYYEAVGWRGWIQGNGDSPLMDQFPSKRNTVFPLYHILATFLSRKEGTWIPMLSSDTLACKGIMLRKEDEQLILIGHYRSSANQVTIEIDVERVEVAIWKENADTFKSYQTHFLDNLIWEKEVVTEGSLKLHLEDYCVVLIRNDV